MVNGMGCCAVREIEYLSDYDTPEEAMGRIVDEEFGNLPAFYVFTGVVGYTNSKRREVYGTKFRDFIDKNRLGAVTESPARHNPNHPTHKVRVWVWAVNHKAVTKWLKKHGDKVKEKRETYGVYF